jgi:hypothetical protein
VGLRGADDTPTLFSAIVVAPSRAAFALAGLSIGELAAEDRVL